MRIVLATTILLVSIPKTSPYRIIFDSLRQHRFTLLISHEILSKYEETILKQIEFPKISCLNIDEFVQLLNS